MLKQSSKLVLGASFLVLGACGGSGESVDSPENSETVGNTASGATLAPVPTVAPGPTTPKDAGTSSPHEDPITCGGIAARPCPDGHACIDDPRDDCNPKKGGSDCSGICQGSSSAY